MLRFHRDRPWISPYSFSVHVALREKGIPFTDVELDFDASGVDAEGFRTASITGKIPLIEHEGLWLSESAAIIEYLEERFPHPSHRSVLPGDRDARARCRMVMSWIRCDLWALREERPTTTMFQSKATQPLSESGQEAMNELLRVADLLIPHQGTQLFGEWSIADADLAFMLHRLILNDHPVPERIRRFAEANWSRPSVREFVEHRAPRL